MTDCYSKSSSCVGYLVDGVRSVAQCTGCNRFYCSVHTTGHGCYAVTIKLCKVKSCNKEASSNGYCNYCSRRTASVGYRPSI